METLEQLISKADAGDVQSCFELGQRFAIGEGTDADESAAFDWYLRAARTPTGSLPRRTPRRPPCGSSAPR